MYSFSKYYSEKFQKDILKFLSAIPEISKHTFEDKKIFTIQYQSLSKDFNYLDFLNITEKAFFGTALFFTVLVDQVCFRYFNNRYEKFYKLTLYPKFVGNSASTDRTNLHPSEIFLAMNYSRDEKKKRESIQIQFSEIFREAIPVIERETKGFFSNHLSDIDGNLFWEKCKNEFPKWI
jgi:hypothetical protein